MKKNYFVDHGLLKPNSSSKAADVLLEVQDDFDAIKYKKPSSYVEAIWEKACNHSDFGRDHRGSGFELLIATILMKENLLPFYWQAKFEFVPLAIFDLAFYTKESGPIILSLKTSVRERYKQAEFEAQALKAVHRRAQTYLITLDHDEAAKLNENIDHGVLFGIDKAIVATTSDFDTLISDLKTVTITKAPTFEVIKDPKTVN